MRVDLRFPQTLVYIAIAKAGDDLLIHQDRLQDATSARPELPEAPQG
ncbi:MAG: hypothetical protein HC822_22370 [Oscillochloris sp.]|nr:hypothetical protein [Oscillochloris sp.]